MRSYVFVLAFAVVHGVIPESLHLCFNHGYVQLCLWPYSCQLLFFAPRFACAVCMDVFVSVVMPMLAQIHIPAQTPNTKHTYVHASRASHVLHTLSYPQNGMCCKARIDFVASLVICDTCLFEEMPGKSAASRWVEASASRSASHFAVSSRVLYVCIYRYIEIYIDI